ncbi:hypothetical protein VCR26J2_350686 [Vibrio coralliirubri]|nr:hypothetical protein VCR6J2_200052 [Vibrio coralliirubri]CDT47426.1 hypothetical protein VCR1J2_590210 [Vibrio coralliirubri]CDT72686.1 hypothetical protein VCR26J2_350686 [Vibrio coralliirubri]CDU02710.1 hypothetical protein VCR8J2_850185 [Vibrio coralliirubri]
MRIFNNFTDLCVFSNIPSNREVGGLKVNLNEQYLALFYELTSYDEAEIKVSRAKYEIPTHNDPSY